MPVRNVLLSFTLQAMLVPLFLFSGFSPAFAACSTPTGAPGAFTYISPEFKFCDGSSWQSMTVSNSGASCATAGVLGANGSDLRFCNGTNWISANGASTGTTCPAGSSGKISWSTTNTRLEWCDGTNWRIVGALTADPCSGKTIGQTCSGTTALYAGVYDGGKYMIMPSGCADSTSNPACSGTDTAQKTWNDGTTNYYDIPAVTNVTAAATASPQQGNVTTPAIAAISSASQGGAHAAARYCENMVYGGYSDWFLPSKSELAYIYCKTPGYTHNVSYPQENPNCGGTVPTGQLTGFSSDIYWTSTEYDGSVAWGLAIMNGQQLLFNKENITNRFVRCLRKY